MRIKEKEQKQQALELYEVTNFHERTVYDTVYKYIVDKATIQKYFPNWDINNNSTPKLQPKRKKA